MSRRITDRFAEHVEAALDRHGQGEDICWETALAPNDQGGTSVVMQVWLPSGTVGEYITGSIAFHKPPPIAHEDVDDYVRRFLIGLRAERTKMLAGAQSAAQEPAAGRSGLILP